MKKRKILFGITFCFFLSIFFYFFIKSDRIFSFNIPIEILVTGCGDGTKQEGEECDGEDLGGKTCELLGYRGGVLKCKINCTFDTSGCLPAISGGGGGVGFLGGTKVILEGKAYPKGKVHLLIDGKENSSVATDQKGNFKFEIQNLNSGIYTFSFWGEDSRQRRSVTISITKRILAGTVNRFSQIFLPPTIDLDQKSVQRGEKIEISGQATPNSNLFLYLEPEKEYIANFESNFLGDWKYFLLTENFKEGTYNIKVKAKTPEGLESPFSAIVTFYVGKYGAEEICPRADFNKDGKVNLVDFSILLHWWGKSNPCIDQNKDGIVNLPDFSILLHWWTG